MRDNFNRVSFNTLEYVKVELCGILDEDGLAGMKVELNNIFDKEETKGRLLIYKILVDESFKRFSLLLGFLSSHISLHYITTISFIFLFSS